MSKHVVATVAEIPPGGRKLVTVRGRSIAVFNLGGEFFGLFNRCPHQGGPMCEGILTGLIESVGLPVQTVGSALEFLALNPVEAEGCLILECGDARDERIGLAARDEWLRYFSARHFSYRPWRYSYDRACPEGRRRSFPHEACKRRRVDERDPAGFGKRSQSAFRARGNPEAS